MSIKSPIWNSLNSGCMGSIPYSRFKRAKNTKYPTSINTPVVKSANRLTRSYQRTYYIKFCIFTTVVEGIIIYDLAQNSRLLYWLFRYFKVSAVILVLCTVVSWFTTGYIAYTNKHMPKWVIHTRFFFLHLTIISIKATKNHETMHFPTASTTRWRCLTRSTTNRGRDLDRTS